LSQTQGAALFLPSEDSNLLLQDIDYVALTEAGTASWDGLETANFAAFESTFGTYEYPQ